MPRHDCLVLKGGVLAALVGAACVLAGLWAGAATARPETGPLSALASQAQVPTPSLTPVRRPSFDSLQQSVTQALQSAGASGGVTLIEMEGPAPQTWSYEGDQQFLAASTYKLPLLMLEAQNITSGRWRSSQSLCYQDDDYEQGYYNDYGDGFCLSRAKLEARVGHDSDNTAARMLVRYDGGASALNSFARAHGAQESRFFDPNTTTSNDLARLWVDEASGRVGGRPAQQYLYPLLTNTSYEAGIPAGVAGQARVVHKIGILDQEVNDAALVLGGPRGSYVLAICTKGVGGDVGWKLVAAISRAVWQYEATR